MKRFLAFQGENYYPGGGWDDFSGDFDTADGAVACLEAEESGRVANALNATFGARKIYVSYESLARNWAHVIDSETGAEVWRAK